MKLKYFPPVFHKYQELQEVVLRWLVKYRSVLGTTNYYKVPRLHGGYNFIAPDDYISVELQTPILFNGLEYGAILYFGNDLIMFKQTASDELLSWTETTAEFLDSVIKLFKKYMDALLKGI